MALRFSLAVNAERDLLNIEDFIASEDETAAVKVVHRLEHAIELLTERPFMRRSVLKPWGTGLRRPTVAPFVVFYKFDATDLQVIRIIHSSRDIEEVKLDT